jgi:hypothetical protein
MSESSSESPFYHYCSTATFREIVHSRTLRLSALSHSNDWREGKVFREIAFSAVDQADLGAAEKELIKGMIPEWADVFDGRGICFSREGDQLGQWRGYADQAHGVSIGFAPGFVRSLVDRASNSGSLRLYPVIYDHLDQRKVAEDALEMAFQFAREGKLAIFRGGLVAQSRRLALGQDSQEVSNHGTLTAQLIDSAFEFAYRLKPSSFAEEQEWRLVDMWPGLFRENIQHFARRDCLVPYTEMQIAPTESAITEIVLGPKNITPEITVGNFLRKAGFGKATVRRSESSLR